MPIWDDSEYESVLQSPLYQDGPETFRPFDLDLFPLGTRLGFDSEYSDESVFESPLLSVDVESPNHFGTLPGLVPGIGFGRHSAMESEGEAFSGQLGSEDEAPSSDDLSPRQDPIHNASAGFFGTPFTPAAATPVAPPIAVPAAVPATAPGPAKKAGSKRKAPAEELPQSSGSPSKEEKVRLQNQRAQKRAREKKKLSEMLRLELLLFFQVNQPYQGDLEGLCEGLVKHLVELGCPFKELRGKIVEFLSQPDHQGGDLAPLFGRLKQFLLDWNACNIYPEYHL